MRRPLLAAMAVVSTVMAGCLDPGDPPLAVHHRASGSADGAGDATADGPPGCGPITAQGCCDGATLRWCASGALKTLSCAAKPKCGWNDASMFYDCGTSGAPDPSGANPMPCSALVYQDAAVDAVDGAADQGPADAPDASLECGPIGAAGCCVGNTLKYCDAGTLEVVDCSNNPACGWQAAAERYDCGTTGGADPDGGNPRQCPGEAPLDLGDLFPADVEDGAADVGADAPAADEGCACAVRGGPPAARALPLAWIGGPLLVVLWALRRRG